MPPDCWRKIGPCFSVSQCLHGEPSKVISVIQVGLIDYATGLRFQQSLVEMRKQQKIGDVLLLLEHTPVITLGRNAKAANVLASAAHLKRRGVEVYDCDRGGDVTFHGPGQLVGYPILDLRTMSAGAHAARKTLGAVAYVRRLEEVLIRTCAEFGISTQRISGLTGVWTNPDDPSGPPEAKIAAIGVHISRAVTSHGFALNVNNDLDYFNLIIPCGIAARPVTSMTNELGKSLSLDEVAQSTARNFGDVFTTEIQWLKSLEDLTGPAGIPMKPPADLRRLHKEEDIFWA
jgi:lipoyl(octanoyl) transferase